MLMTPPLNTLTGFNEESDRAGPIPDNIPISKIEMTNMILTGNCINVFRRTGLSIMLLKKGNPIKISIIAAAKAAIVTKTDSVRKRSTISSLFAPIVFRIPISLFLWFCFAMVRLK